MGQISQISLHKHVYNPVDMKDSKLTGIFAKSLKERVPLLTLWKEFMSDGVHLR